jgi:predicted ATP-grasp superfamily ATP-dependent carboligase
MMMIVEVFVSSVDISVVNVMQHTKIGERRGKEMTNYLVSWTEEIWYRVNIQANSVEEARELFWSGEFDTEESFGGEIQDGVDIKPAELGEKE